MYVTKQGEFGDRNKTAFLNPGSLFGIIIIFRKRPSYFAFAMRAVPLLVTRGRRRLHFSIWVLLESRSGASSKDRHNKLFHGCPARSYKLLKQQEQSQPLGSLVNTSELIADKCGPHLLSFFFFFDNVKLFLNCKNHNLTFSVAMWITFTYGNIFTCNAICVIYT